MSSVNKIPQVIPMAPLPQPSFLIGPAPSNSYTLQMPNSSLQSVGLSPWPLTPLRPVGTTIPAYNPPEVFYAHHSTDLVPATVSNTTGPDNTPLSPTSPEQRTSHTPPPPSNSSPCHPSVKKELESSGCMRAEVDQDSKRSYPINALIDVPGSLNRGSRTSSLSSSLSSFRFGGSLSQIWATSLSSLSGKLHNMKSTGNLHSDASLPSLGNQYYAFGGSLPELSLTSLTRLLPTSSGSSTDTPSTGGGLFTLIQPSLCVYPSQSHLATPFINANGSITFGSFLSSGSSLCSTKKESSDDNRDPPTSSPAVCSTSSTAAPGNLSTLAYVASVQKNLETEDQTPTFPLMTVTTQLQGHSPIPPSSGLSPITHNSCLSPDGGNLDMECHVSSPVVIPPQCLVKGIKCEEEDHQTMGNYSEVKPLLAKKESKDKPYKCDYPGCGRSFSFPAHLRSHVQQIHISYRPCKCDFPGCGKRFYTPQHLNVHRRIHTGERPFVCPYVDCGKAFTTAGNLKNHIRTHTGERPYACKFDGCAKRFAEMSSLKKHELTHTGEKPYKCRVCGKAFSQAGSRNTHERKHSRNDDVETKVSRRYRIKRVSQSDDP